MTATNSETWTGPPIDDLPDEGSVCDQQDKPDMKRTGKKRKKNKTSMPYFVRKLNDFGTVTVRTLTKQHMVVQVWYQLFQHENRDKDEVCISQDTLAENLNCSIRTIQRAFRKLQQLKLAIKTYEGGNGRGVDRYRIYGIPHVEK